MASSFDDDNKSILDKLDDIVPVKEFDAFPKVQTTYTTNTTLGGIATVMVIALSFLLSLNDVGEYLWGWPDFEYSVDKRLKSTLDINLDLVVAIPCQYVSVDVRDAAGDRLHLSKTFTRDGTTFDASQAHRLESHGAEQSVAEVVTAAKKKSGGLFAAFQSQGPSFRPTYNHVPGGDACRIYGSVEVKRVTGNLHITTLGHGYSSREHTDHKLINLTHVISEFSFGPYFPNIAQPLDYTYEKADDPFTAFQYFITVVPTVYNAPRSRPLRTNQYSVTTYKRVMQHGRGTPGIFFKFDIDPIEMTIFQRTTSFTQFIMRLCGVIGGVWVCAGWAFKVTSKAATLVGGKDEDGEIVKQSEMKKSATQRWAGGELRNRANNWSIDGGSPYNSTFSPYAASPQVGFQSPVNGNAYFSPIAQSPNVASPHVAHSPPMDGTSPITVRAPTMRAAVTAPVNGSPAAESSPTAPSYTNGSAQPPRAMSGLNPAASKRTE